MLNEKAVNIIRNTLGNEAAQATIKVFNSPYIVIKIFWIVCLLVACCLAAFFVIESLIVFVTYKINTNTRTIFESSSLFPKITFCQKNPFTTKYAFETIQMANLSLQEALFKTNYKMDENERLMMQHPLSKVLIDCAFNGEKCTYNDFVHEFDYNLGNCYIFNSGFNSTGHRVELKSSTRTGSSYGLKLTVYVNYYTGLKNEYYGCIFKIGKLHFYV